MPASQPARRKASTGIPDTNPLERINGEIKRRSEVVGIFPNEAAVVRLIGEMPNDSIYEGRFRLAQPDEVWNYRRGDGLERALLLANIWKARHPLDALALASDGATVTLKLGAREVCWPTAKAVALNVTL